MDGHPGGREHTLHMLALSGLTPGSSVLDMGAGAGEAVALMEGLGLQAKGIDLCPRGPGVIQGDFLHTGLPGESLDGVLSECAFCQSGDAAEALREAHRLLKPGGVLMVSDVWFSDPLPLLRERGFRVDTLEDMTQSWKQYYIEAIWRGTADCVPVKEKCKYLLLICRKEGQDGSV